MDRHNWDYEEVQHCINRIFETFVLNEEYDYEKLLNELYIHFDTKIKKGSLKMFFSNIKYLFNQNKVPNTLMISELKNVSLTARTAFDIAMKKYNQKFIENKNIKVVEDETKIKETTRKHSFNEPSDNRCAGIGSTITYRVIEDDEINQVTLVEPGNKKLENEVSRNSDLGEALLYSKEGEEVQVNSLEPYKIIILHISNPIYAIKLDKNPNKETFYGDEIPAGVTLTLSAINEMCEQIKHGKKIRKRRERNMTNAEEQRKIFWELFEEILMENGEPFNICYKMGDKICAWANINKNHAWNENAIDISFRTRDCMLRVDLYVQRGEDILLGRRILNNKEDINSMVTKSINWEYGTSNAKTLRPSVYFSFIRNNKEDYRRVIEESLPTIMEFINVANKYGKDEFFDF